MAVLQPISGRVAYLPGANNLGVIAADDGGAIVVDTGLDKDTGRLLRKALDEAGLKLRAIINTHHHADHIGGNEYLVRNLPGVVVHAPPLEAALIEHPVLEPLYLNMGAVPPTPLRTKWLMAKGTPVQHLIEGQHVIIAGVALEIVPLQGHSLNQIGVVCDGVCFAADGFFGPEVLHKHGIPYAQDISGQLASIARLAQRSESFFVPGHGDLVPQHDLADALRANQDAITRATAAVEQALDQPGDLAAIGRQVAHKLDLHFAGIPQYAIFCSVVSAHLAHLEQQGRATLALQDAGIVWSK